MQKVMYSVPLDKLYKVVASCQYNDNGEFCPVLCKIIDPTVLKNNKGMEYLLQVWSSRGDMVFEKPLREPISNWNISGDKFLFQENHTSTSVFVVRLFMDRPAIIFKFNLPEDVHKNRINSYYDRESKTIVIPKEVPKLNQDEFG